MPTQTEQPVFPSPAQPGPQWITFLGVPVAEGAVTSQLVVFEAFAVYRQRGA